MLEESRGIKKDTLRDTLARIRGLAVFAGVWLTASLRRSAPTYEKRYRIRGVFATTRYTNLSLLSFTLVLN